MRVNQQNLTQDQVNELFKIIRTSKSTKEILKAKEILWESVYSLIVRTASKYGAKGSDYQDLISAGCQAVMTSINMYDPERKTKFSSYAWRHISKDIGRCRYRQVYQISDARHIIFKGSFAVLKDVYQATVQEALDDEVLKKLSECMDKLEEEEKICLQYAFFSNRKEKAEIRKKLGYRYNGSISFLKYKALAKLKKLMEGYET